MADVKWIKITTDIFDDEKILLIESVPSADSILVIWFKLLALAGKQNNNGVIMLNDRIAYTEEMLAAVFRRDHNLVSLALDTFEQLGMIERYNNVIAIPNWDKHQSLDSYEAKKARDRLYQSKRREKQRLLAQESSDNRLTSDEKSLRVAVSEEDIEEDIDKELNILSGLTDQIVYYLNSKLTEKGMSGRYKSTTPKTQRLIKARQAEGFSLDDFKSVIDKKVESWAGTDMEKYLRPETLFGTKFEGYLNESSSVDETWAEWRKDFEGRCAAWT